MEGKYENRYDVTVLINGFPVVQIELKRRGLDFKEAFNQIQRYRRHSYQGLYRYLQLYIISNGTDTHVLILWDGFQAGKTYTGYTGVLGSTFVSLKLKKDTNNKFINYYFKHTLEFRQARWREGSGLPHVSRDFVENYKFFLPCYKEQLQISKILDHIGNSIKAEKEKMISFSILKKDIYKRCLFSKYKT